MPGYEGKVLWIIPLHKMFSQEATLSVSCRGCAGLCIGAVSLHSHLESDHTAEPFRYLRHLEEQLSERNSSLRQQDTSGQNDLVGSPYGGESEIDLSTPHPPQFLLEDQPAVRWRETTHGMAYKFRLNTCSRIIEADLVQFKIWTLLYTLLLHLICSESRRREVPI